MSEVPENVIRLAEALYDTLNTYSAGMGVREVHVALSTFIAMAIRDGENALEQAGRYDLAGRLRAEFIELLAEP